MKNLIKFLGIVAILCMVMISCESDPSGGVDPVQGPSITATSAATILGPEEMFTVSVNATAGDAEMNSFVIIENGVQLAPDRISEIVGLGTVNNPALLFDGDRASFTYDITLSSNTEGGDYVYSFRVIDDNMESATSDIFITIDSIRIKSEYFKLLFHPSE